MTKRSFPIYTALILIIGACTFTQKIKDGETAYERKQYAKAVDMLSSEYEKTRDREFRAYRAYLLGESYMRMNLPENAKTWYRQAFEDGYGVNALEKYASALMADQQYENAKRAYSKLIDDYGETS